MAPTVSRKETALAHKKRALPHVVSLDTINERLDHEANRTRKEIVQDDEAISEHSPEPVAESPSFNHCSSETVNVSNDCTCINILFCFNHDIRLIQIFCL